MFLTVNDISDLRSTKLAGTEIMMILYEKALHIHRQVGNRRSEGSTLSNLAGLCHFQGDLVQAASGYEQALDVYREIGDRRGEAHVLSNLALLFSQTGRAELGIVLCQQALTIFREAHDRYSEANTLSNLALCYSVHGQIPEAWTMYQKALEVCREVGDLSLEGTTLGWMATLKRRTEGDLTQAEQLNRRDGQAKMIFIYPLTRIWRSILRRTAPVQLGAIPRPFAPPIGQRRNSVQSVFMING